VAPRAVFNDEHDLFRETVAEFVRREIVPRRETIREQRKIDRSIWAKAGEQDLLGIGVPERYGGAGIDDFRFNAVMQEELVRAGMAYASAFQVHADVVAPYLVELTTEDQRGRWLPGFCTGELVTAIGMSEPGGGSDLAALKTTAVEKGMPGFAPGRKLEKVGQHEADTAELFFEDVQLPPENLIGELGRGFAAMMERLPFERLRSACGNVAHAATALEHTLAYVRERRAFGRPVGSFQANRFLLAELVTLVDVTQAYVDQCLLEHVEGSLDPTVTAKAKWWTADVQNRVLDACVQLFGGYGYMAEYEVARAWSDARVTKIWAGSNEIMKELIGRSLGLGDERGAG
jgi:alkylation response protein AidB-like acyl-CoA dehydrogenase